MAGNLYPIPDSLVELAGSGNLEIGDGGATGRRSGMCDAEDLLGALRYLLGDVRQVGDNFVRYGADQWPGFPLLRANKVTVKTAGRNSDATWSAGIGYDKALLEVSYAVPPYRDEDDPDDNAPEDEPYLIQSLDYSVEIITVPMRVGTGPFEEIANRPIVNRHVRIPTVTYTATVPKHKNPNWAAIQDAVGKVNSVAIFGGAAGTVLYDGAQANREVIFLGESAWQLAHKFIYNRFGWNNTLNPKTLAWEPAFDETTGATPPYESTDLKAVFE